jgi:hypothetical protein
LRFDVCAILADEVGLGKTIEAGLVIAQSRAEGAQRILLIVPKSLIGQWQNELLNLFGIQARENETSFCSAPLRRSTAAAAQLLRCRVHCHCGLLRRSTPPLLRCSAPPLSDYSALLSSNWVKCRCHCRRDSTHKSFKILPPKKYYQKPTRNIMSKASLLPPGGDRRSEEYRTNVSNAKNDGNNDRTVSAAETAPIKPIHVTLDTLFDAEVQNLGLARRRKVPIETNTDWLS